MTSTPVTEAAWQLQVPLMEGTEKGESVPVGPRKGTPPPAEEADPGTGRCLGGPMGDGVGEGWTKGCGGIW